MTENAELAKAERILRREDWDSLEQQVAAQREALLALHQALRDIGRHLEERLNRLEGRRRGFPGPESARY